MAIAVRAEAERLGAVCLALAACVLRAGLQHPMLGRGRRGQRWCWASAPGPEAEAHTMAIAVRAEAEGLGAGCLSPAAREQPLGLQHPPWGLACPTPGDLLHCTRGTDRELPRLLRGGQCATGRLPRLLGPGLVGRVPGTTSSV